MLSPPTKSVPPSAFIKAAIVFAIIFANTFGFGCFNLISYLNEDFSSMLDLSLSFILSAIGFWCTAAKTLSNNTSFVASLLIA